MSGATVPTPPVLLAISTEIACFCAQQQKAFLSCKKLDHNPEDCGKDADEVTECTVNLMKDINMHAPQELKAFVDCIGSHGNDFRKCREEQEAFEVALKAGRIKAR